MNDSRSESYAAAGVDITAGYRAVELMKAHIARTMTAGVASGVGGERIVSECQRVLKEEYPALAQKLRVMLPDENFRRVGQSMAAASLPEV